MKAKLLISMAFTMMLFSANATIEVASILGDNMVLQRNSEVKIWGKSAPNQKLTISTSWNNTTYNTVANESGDWLVKVKTNEAGGPYSVNISSKNEKVTLNNILLGEVWICSGQSNMEMTMAGIPDSPVNGMNDALVDADNDNIRFITVNNTGMSTPQDTFQGIWKVSNAETVAHFSALGYFYAKLLQKKLRIPIGMVNMSWGGSRIESWMSKETLANFPKSFESSSKETRIHQQPSKLYNGMVHPILNFGIKGVIWYQGESNINYTEYADLLVGMVANWRKDFGIGEFPFYFVQIAPYQGTSSSNSTFRALQRENHLKASFLIPNSGMVSTIDIGEADNVHPAEKLTIAKRLSYWALSETYGFKGIFHKNPTFKSFETKDSTLVLSFDNLGNGLSSFGKQLDNFEVAGADRKFYPAKAKIVNSKLEVFSPEVKQPVAVRYAFYDFPHGQGFLYNVAGIPVPPFRSDNW
ncbi:MAG: sialate O-acetylesterase [Bacteroidota bacterium]|nr:sialate O-acetylesterase [Bacteroidota bacterium]